MFSSFLKELNILYIRRIVEPHRRRCDGIIGFFKLPLVNGVWFFTAGKKGLPATAAV